MSEVPLQGPDVSQLTDLQEKSWDVSHLRALGVSLPWAQKDAPPDKRTLQEYLAHKKLTPPTGPRTARGRSLLRILGGGSFL